MLASTNRNNAGYKVCLNIEKGKALKLLFDIYASLMHHNTYENDPKYR